MPLKEKDSSKSEGVQSWYSSGVDVEWTSVIICLHVLLQFGGSTLKQPLIFVKFHLFILSSHMLHNQLS